METVHISQTIETLRVVGSQYGIDPEVFIEPLLADPTYNELASSIFTQSGQAARRFKYDVDASMAAVNIGVAAPMSFFSFGGAKGSFFGDLKAHGREAFDFFTDRKVMMSRWD